MLPAHPPKSRGITLFITPPTVTRLPPIVPVRPRRGPTMLHPIVAGFWRRRMDLGTRIEGGFFEFTLLISE